MDKFNISVGAHNSLDDTVWSTTTGGANDTTAPGVLDKAIYDANSLGACSWNTPSVLDVDMRVGIVSTIVQTVDFICLNDFNQDAGSWTASGFKFQVNGQRNGITPAIFIQDNSAGSSMYIGTGLDYRSTQTGNVWDSNDIILGFGNIGIIFESRNDDFKTRMNLTFTPGNTFKMIGRMYIDLCKAAGGTYIITDNGAQQQWTDCNFDQMDEIDFQPTALNRVRLTLDGTQFDGEVNFNGCQIDSGQNFDLLATSRYINAGTINHWITGTAVGTIQGFASCENFNSGNASLTTRGGNMTVTGSLIVNDATVVWEDDTLVTNKLDVSGADEFKTGSLIVENAADFDFDGKTFMLSDFMTINAGANISSNAGRIRTIGDQDQAITCGGKLTAAASFGGFDEFKSGGILNYVDVWTSLGKHKIRAQKAYSVKYLISAAYGSDEFDCAPGFAGSNRKVTIDSSDGATQFDYTVNGASATVTRNAIISRMKFLGATQPSDNTSTTIGSGTTTVPPDATGFSESAQPVGPGINHGPLGLSMTGLKPGLIKGNQI